MKRTIKQQVFEGVQAAILKMKEEGKYYLHFSELKFETDDYYIEGVDIGIPYTKSLSYEQRLAWEYLRNNFFYGQAVCYHGNKRVFILE